MKPWTPEQRTQKTSKMRKEAARAAARLGAHGVVLVAFYEEGEFMHMLDAGMAPMPFKDLYEKLAGMHDKVDGGFEGYLS